MPNPLAGYEQAHAQGLKNRLSVLQDYLQQNRENRLTTERQKGLAKYNEELNQETEAKKQAQRLEQNKAVQRILSTIDKTKPDWKQSTVSQLTGIGFGLENIPAFMNSFRTQQEELSDYREKRKIAAEYRVPRAEPKPFQPSQYATELRARELGKLPPVYGSIDYGATDIPSFVSEGESSVYPPTAPQQRLSSLKTYQELVDEANALNPVVVLTETMLRAGQLKPDDKLAQEYKGNAARLSALKSAMRDFEGEAYSQIQKQGGQFRDENEITDEDIQELIDQMIGSGDFK